MLEPKEEIRQKLDVADVIGGYLQLKPAGSGSFKAVCPFHAERTPSFHVSRERQIWHCFGCDKGGDIFAFVMEMEGMMFPEALQHLAARAGVALPEHRPAPKEETDMKATLLRMHTVAQKFYATLLANHADATDARRYLRDRGITDELITTFGLGYAPDRWDALVQFLGSRGFRKQDIEHSGLALRKKNGDGLLDRFRHRIMIPLYDPVGNVVAFTARVMTTQGATTTPDGPKYMNSPESPIYHKGRMLYGLHLAKTGIRTAQCVLVVEGNLDVIASHKAGVENVVASSGTALTEEQLRILSRYTKHLVFALDGDAAGVAAAKRVFDLALKLQTHTEQSLAIDVRCVVIPPDAGKDPDEVVQKDPALWQRLAASSRPVIDFFFDTALRAYERKGTSATIEDRKALVQELLPALARLRSPEERHLYLLRIADATHVPMEMLSELVRTEGKGVAAGGRAAVPLLARPRTPLKTVDRAAAFLLALLCANEALAPELRERLPEAALPPEPWRRLYSAALALYDDAQPTGATAQSLFSRLRTQQKNAGADDDVRVIDRTLLTLEEQIATLSAEDLRAELDLHITLLQRALRATQRRELEAAIREAELTGAGDTLRTLLAEYARLLNAESTGRYV